MKICFCVVLTVLSASRLFASSNQILASEIDGRLSMLKRDAGRYGYRVKYDSDVLFDCEVAYASSVRGRPTAVFSPIVEIMSNNWQEVLMDIDDYATNVIDRVLLENTASFLGEDAYLGYLSMLADKVISDEIPLEELERLQVNSWHNHAVSSALYRRYQEPAVSNLVIKLQQAGVSTNKCQRILSGEANAHYQSLLVKGHLD